MGLNTSPVCLSYDLLWSDVVQTMVRYIHTIYLRAHLPHTSAHTHTHAEGGNEQFVATPTPPTVV